MYKSLITILFLLFASTIYAQTSYLLYGGKNHDQYLGCLNCNNADQSSIWNSYGTYGSKFNANSIWNIYGSYSGKYSMYSPFNAYATNPPVIVDKDGNFYGYLTVNKYQDKRTTIKLALIICDNWDLIVGDVSGWYDHIFK